MGFLFPRRQPNILPSLPTQPTEDDDEVKRAESEERERIRRVRGRSSTILTQGSDLGTAPTMKSILGGGK